MKVKKTTLYLIGILFLIIVSGYLMIDFSSENKTYTGGTGEVQKVVIGMKDYNYYPNTINVKANQPVEISLDNSVYGCFRDFTIRDFGIREYLKTPEDTIVFTPDRKGTFTFACSMGMGTGTLIVE